MLLECISWLKYKHIYSWHEGFMNGCAAYYIKYINCLYSAEMNRIDQVQLNQTKFSESGSKSQQPRSYIIILETRLTISPSVSIHPGTHRHTHPTHTHTQTHLLCPACLPSCHKEDLLSLLIQSDDPLSLPLSLILPPPNKKNRQLTRRPRAYRCIRACTQCLKRGTIS